MNTLSTYSPNGPNRKSVDSAEVRKSTPNGLIDWMQHTVHETGVEQKRPRTSQLRKWQFTTAAANRRGSTVGLVNARLSVDQAIHLRPRPNEIPSSAQNSRLFGLPPTNGSSPAPMYPSPPQMYSPDPPALGLQRHRGYEKLRAESHDHSVRDSL
jgi:hypothetical protein